MARPKISPRRNPYYTNGAYQAGFTIGVETANAITTNVQLRNEMGDNVAVNLTVQWFLATDAAGTTPGAALTGGVVSGTNGKVGQNVAGISGFATSDAQGRIDFVMTDTGTPTRYLVIVMPDGSRQVSGAHTWA